MTSTQNPSPTQPDAAGSSTRRPVVSNLLGLLVVAIIGAAIYFIAAQSPVPGIVAVLAGVFGGIFVGLVLLPEGARSWLDGTFSRVSVIVLGSWLGMSLTMGSITVYMASMQDDMHRMRGDMTAMQEDINGMYVNIELMAVDIDDMSYDIDAMSDDIQVIDDAIRYVDQTLGAEIGPAVRIMAPAVNDMGHSMHRGVQSFSNPMEYMRNALMPFP
jgi:hypothetical protein